MDKRRVEIVLEDLEKQASYYDAAAVNAKITNHDEVGERLNRFFLGKSEGLRMAITWVKDIGLKN